MAPSVTTSSALTNPFVVDRCWGVVFVIGVVMLVAVVLPAITTIGGATVQLIRRTDS